MKENHPLVENCGNVPRGTRVIAAVSSLVRVRIENLSMLFFTPPCAPESNADRRRPEASEPSRVDLIPGTTKDVLPGDPEVVEETNILLVGEDLLHVVLQTHRPHVFEIGIGSVSGTENSLEGEVIGQGIAVPVRSLRRSGLEHNREHYPAHSSSGHGSQFSIWSTPDPLAATQRASALTVPRGTLPLPCNPPSLFHLEHRRLNPHAHSLTRCRQNGWNHSPSFRVSSPAALPAVRFLVQRSLPCAGLPLSYSSPLC